MNKRLDERLRQLNESIVWHPSRKEELLTKIVETIENERDVKRKNLSFVYVCSVAFALFCLFVGAMTFFERDDLPRYKESRTEHQLIDKGEENTRDDHDRSVEEEIEQLANVWAEALKTRDGKPRYEMMTLAAQEKFIREQLVMNDGDELNFTIGVSSPWVIHYDIEVDGWTAIITYTSMTSDPAYFESKETVTFTEENGTILVADFETEYEYRPVDNE